MNSLYGKFGMRMENTIIELFNTSNEKDQLLFEKLVEEHGTNIQDFIKINNHILSVRKSLIDYKYSDEEDMFHGLDVNIALASGIAGGARTWMSIIKKSTKFNLFYSDTDSWVTDTPIPSVLVGPELGQFKLECVIKKAVFLAPKVYGFITTDGEEVIKVKGLNKEAMSDIHFNDLEQLLHKDSSKVFSQNKWYKKLFEGDISVNEVAYTLKTTSNKRDPIYIENVYSNTKPYNYNEININNKK